MKVVAEFNEKDYGLLCKPEEVKPLMTALNELYAVIWTEACYDAKTDETRTMCRHLLPHIQTINDVLRFHK